MTFGNQQSRGVRGFNGSLLLSLLTGLSVAALPTVGWAHADLDERIQQVSARIESKPGNAELFAQRADLHRRHGDFELALADLAAAERLEPALDVIAFARARTLVDAGQLQESVAVLDGFLKNHAKHAPALALRAQAQVRLGRVDRAIQDYTAALRNYASPPPDLFIERARVQAARGGFAEAVKGLDEGLQRLGHVPGLEMAAIDYLRQSGDFAEALHRAEKMTGRSTAKEAGLLLQAELLEQAGRWVESRQKFKEVLSTITACPPTRRNSGATLELEKKALAGMARTQARLASVPRTETRTDGSE